MVGRVRLETKVSTVSSHASVSGLGPWQLHDLVGYDVPIAGDLQSPFLSTGTDLGCHRVGLATHYVTLGKSMNLSKSQSTQLESKKDGSKIIFPLHS